MKALNLKAIVATIALATATIASAQSLQTPYINMQSSAEQQVTPDEIYISITIKESDYKGKATLQEKQQAMLSILKTNKINIDECLSLNFMGSNVSYKTFSRKPTPQSQATYILKLNDAAIMQNVIYSLEEEQISNIQLIETKYTKEDSIRKELGIQAMKKAQEEAASLAGAVGQEIGKAITISSWFSQNSPQPRMYKARNDLITLEESAQQQPNSAAQISIAKITYNVNVDVKFELK